MTEDFDQRPRTFHEAKSEQQLTEIEALLRAIKLTTDQSAERIGRLETAQRDSAGVAIQARDGVHDLKRRFDEAEEQRGLVLEELERNTTEIRKVKAGQTQIRRVVSTTGSSLEQLREHVMDGADRLGKRVKGLEDVGKRTRQRAGRRR